MVVVARTPSAQFEASLRDTGFVFVADRAGDFWDACGITSTPLVVKADNVGLVIAKGVTQDVEEVALGR